MQYEVHPTDQTQDMDPNVNGSFKTAYALHKKNSQKSTRIFPDVQFSRGFHRKSEFSFYTVKSDHSRLRFPSKSAQSWKTLKNGCFWHCIVIIEWYRFFPGNPAVSVFLLYQCVTPCKKLEPTYGWKYHNFWTDTRTDTLTISAVGLNWSWGTVTSWRTCSTLVL